MSTMASLRTRIQDNAQLYERLTSDLAQEHDVSMAYEDISSQSAALSEKLKSLQVELKFLSQTTKKEYDDLHKARHFSVRSAAASLKGKKKALIAKEEAEYQQAFETEQRAKRNVDIVSSDLSSLCDKEKQLKDQKDHLKNIRSQLEGLLDDVFAEPDGTQVLEPQLRAELVNYTEQFALATRDRQRFRDTDHNIVHALRNIGKAKEILKVATNFVPFDLFGGAIIDEQQIIYIEACQRTVWECQRRLNVIRDILPEIPYPNTLDVVTNNYLLGLRFEGGYVDLSWKAKTQQGFGVLVTAEKNVKSAMQWVRHYLHYAEGATERLTVALETTKASLYSERRRIFDQALSISTTATAQMTPSAPDRHDIIPDDVPPPVYEPPIPADAENHLQNPEIPDGNRGTTPPYLNIPSPTMDSGRHLRTASQSSSVSSIPSHPPPTLPPQERIPPTSSSLTNNILAPPSSSANTTTTTTAAAADPHNSHHSYTTSNMNNPFRSSLPPPN